MKKIILILVVCLLMIVGMGCASMKLDFDSQNPDMIDYIKIREKRANEANKKFPHKSDFQQDLNTGKKHKIKLNNGKCSIIIEHYNAKSFGFIVGEEKVNNPTKEAKLFESLYIPFLKEEFSKRGIITEESSIENEKIVIKIAIADMPFLSSLFIGVELLYNGKKVARGAVLALANEKFFRQPAYDLAQKTSQRFLNNIEIQLNY